MTLSMFRSVAGSILVALGGIKGAAAAQISVESFARLPMVRAASLSPSGTHLLYLNTDERGHVGVAGVDLATMAPFAVNLEGDDVYDVTWVTDTRIAFNVAMRRRYSRGLYIYQIGDKVAEGINDQDLTDVISVLREDRSRMYVWYLAGSDHRRKGLALIDTNRRKVAGMGRANEESMVVRWVAAPPGEIHGWLADRSGQVRIGITFHQDRLRAWIHDQDGDPWEELPFDLEADDILGFTGTGTGLYVVRDDGTSPTESLCVYDIVSREWGPALFRDPDFSLKGAWLRFSRKESGAVGIIYHRDAVTAHWFSARFKTIQATVDAKLPGRLNVLTSWDEEESRFVVAAYSDRAPTDYFLYDVAKDAVSALPKSAPWIDPQRMRPMQTIRYRARDGLPLQGYLTIPASSPDGTRPPLVVYPHGGPWSRDVWGWDPVVQFLVSRGYAVFQPNYRGSTGFKREVVAQRSDFRAMFDDVIDGTKAVTRAGLVDPDRVAIYGGSFGGYLAMAGAAFTPDQFKCAVSFAGVFDWAQLVAQSRYRREARALKDFHRRYIGDPKADAARFESMSPLAHAASIKIPVLLVHGTEDRVVEHAQTRRLIRVLKEHGVPCESLFFKDEGHGLADPANEEKFLARLEQFLARNL